MKLKHAQSQLRQDGYWRWTITIDRETCVMAPCSSLCKHQTSKESDRHFYDWCFDQAKVFEAPNTGVCHICDARTNKKFGNNDAGMLLIPVYLCDKHRNIARLKDIYPFLSSEFFPINIWYTEEKRNGHE
jgi:hypothetical protein